MGTSEGRSRRKWTARSVRAGAAALALATGGLVLGACSSSGSASGNTPAQGSAGSGGTQATTASAVHVNLIGKIDASTGAPGTFTGKDGWPAVAPSDFTIPHGATVVLTIKEYDDMSTPLPMAEMMYDKVMGGTETVNGSAVSVVNNQQIAHTFTIPTLGINVPLPMAPKDGFNTVVFTFTAPAKAGTYVWQCFTPCGDGPDGTGGAMQTFSWMRGHVTVS